MLPPFSFPKLLLFQVMLQTFWTVLCMVSFFVYSQEKPGAEEQGEILSVGVVSTSCVR